MRLKPLPLLSFTVNPVSAGAVDFPWLSTDLQPPQKLSPFLSSARIEACSRLSSCPSGLSCRSKKGGGTECRTTNEVVC